MHRMSPGSNCHCLRTYMRTGFSQQCFLTIWINCSLRCYWLQERLIGLRNLNSRRENVIWTNQKEQVAMRLWSGFQPCRALNKQTLLRSQQETISEKLLHAVGGPLLSKQPGLNESSTELTALGGCLKTHEHFPAGQVLWMHAPQRLQRQRCIGQEQNTTLTKISQWKGYTPALHRAQLLNVETTMSKKAFHYHPPYWSSKLWNPTNPPMPNAVGCNN